MKVIDTIIHNITCLITMQGNGLGIIEDGAVAISGNTIEAVGTTKDIDSCYSAHRYVDGKDKVVMPGFINAHMHSALGFLRGLAQDVDDWMQRGLWPFMSIMDDDDIMIGAMINVIEAVKSGITTCCDIDVPMRKLVKNHYIVGTRARVCETITELSTDADEVPVGELYPLNFAVGNRKFQDNITLYEEWHGRGDGRINVVFGPQAPDLVSEELLKEIRQQAEKKDTAIHMHVACGEREIDQMIKRYGKRSIPYLDEIGYLTSRLTAVHLSCSTIEELELFAKRGAAMILCSNSEAIIDGNIPPAAEFLRFSPKLALGTDQSAGNNCNTMFAEMKMTSFLNKCKFKDPIVFSSWEMLRRVTIDGARAIGMDNEVGSLEKGKKADIICIDLNTPSLQPVFTKPIRNIVPNLVYAANGSEVETVIIDGKFVVDNRKLMTLDEKEVIQRAYKQVEKFIPKVEKKITDMDLPITKLMKDGHL